ncbi:hypothetical protein KXV22_001848 [Aspergillus fumigatus]|nr:hypothetical protein KXX45_001371 [Aspergillus fumigatus]KAH1328391.1 hypothetical protein KXX47_008161 [Aspergillus fumigatus]KAH1366449.1 hypothetical protein KXX63_002928 [Aspergillus fumigatus]KAH1386796.1 hypothetical protein KXX50_004073 [Aspergillus fumigatus]KAH1386923.1 hypothetical protein KXX10_003642 [Aspergillus fumigatus]
MEWVSVLAYHMLVVAGVALTAAGPVKLQEHKQPLDKAAKIAKEGIAILAVAWGVLLNPVTGSLAIRVVLGFMPEVIATLAYIFAGVKKQGAARLAQEEEEEGGGEEKEMVPAPPKPRA